MLRVLSLTVWSILCFAASDLRFFYIFYQQFVGRCATGLPLTDRIFSSLPPHFLYNEPLLTNEMWKDILPDYEVLPSSFKAALPYLLASLIYHKAFLTSTLCEDHPLFLTRVWTNGIIGVLEAKVLSGCGRNPVSQMTATGVPPTLVLANQMEALTEKFSELEESSVKMHEEFVQTVTEKFDQLPESISSHIRATLEITGAVAATAGDVSNIVSSMLVGVQKTLLDDIEM